MDPQVHERLARLEERQVTIIDRLDDLRSDMDFVVMFVHQFIAVRDTLKAQAIAGLKVITAVGVIVSIASVVLGVWS